MIPVQRYTDRKHIQDSIYQLHSYTHVCLKYLRLLQVPYNTVYRQQMIMSYDHDRSEFEKYQNRKFLLFQSNLVDDI